MEGIQLSLRSYHEKSAGILSETSWTTDLSNMPRLTQELISKYFMEEMVYGCLVKGRTKYKSQAANFLKNNIWKKLL